MRQSVSLMAVGHATSLVLAITFAVCVAFDLLFREHAMFEVWRRSCSMWMLEYSLVKPEMWVPGWMPSTNTCLAKS